MFFYVYRDAQGLWRWKYYGGRMEIIAHAAHSHEDRDKCLSEIDLMKASRDVRVIVQPEPR